MAIDLDKIDDTILGLLWLTLHDENRAWKGIDWGALDRLHKKGLIADPANKTKSVVLSDEGLRRAQTLFHAMFTRPAPTCPIFQCQGKLAPSVTEEWNYCPLTFALIHFRKFEFGHFGLANMPHDKVALGAADERT